jgi:general secretion pathway protein G
MGRNTVTGEIGTGRRWGRSSGFTLIELMIVVSLIIVLASIGLVTYKSSITRGREAVLREDLFRMREAIDQYYVDKGKYPMDLAELASAGYIRAVPVDPFTNSSDTWQLIPAEPDPNNPTVDLGVYNVQSGSEQLSLEGSPYSDW